MRAAAPLFPVFLKLVDRPVIIVGGGSVATAKLSALLDADARVTVVAPEVTPEIAGSGVTIRRRRAGPDLPSHQHDPGDVRRRPREQKDQHGPRRDTGRKHRRRDGRGSRRPLTSTNVSTGCPSFWSQATPFDRL